MGKAKATRKFAQVKRVLNPKDQRVQKNNGKKDKPATTKNGELVREVPQVASNLFFQYNESLGPPYHVLIDTNFINFCLQQKIEVFDGLMSCLYAKTIPCITDCVMAELEKLGIRYRIALRIAKDERMERLPCTHKGVYADDCIVNRVMQHKCYLVATNDKNLKQRIRKIPGVPILSVANHKIKVERLVDVVD
ncbi:rRNA processing protein Fcf1 [Schizosaccharomyces cryophilus OY26]|uniref:rRNA processing protein Fcf1 n=1 Tax=Schizosaccharomyces cryophilus (strain OY26 / ATCC MYA-4695 / CBS 11777 / NBRC 106824 / NRRL Y48691) TaxID=653667 RepID=S9VSS9_SCHCR|nr:rRNA processing protein Fcf1 [Schizosaccharomyces cryophilus OY26]EPY49229.1 rRNA processing protein Fcf1 [Schizosaccharomyces cryophilus OY26]